MSIIRDSYKIASHSTPLPCHLKNNASAVEEGAFVGKAALDVLRDDRVEEVFPLPKILNPLSVSVQSSGRKRVFFGSKTHVHRQEFKCVCILSKTLFLESVSFFPLTLSLDTIM